MNMLCDDVSLPADKQPNVSHLSKSFYQFSTKTFNFGLKMEYIFNGYYIVLTISMYLGVYCGSWCLKYM